ncbi:uncharacterized protein LOC106660600 [Trichogramma pretiosum]|uniref:uncharacterized protein LOC106660600 n=1 Tax=Trichogramma pretiosum TaxID=7493 RepID=UPI0006C9BBB6|nr:uncharacterized protein LOC106660600 [Trichogramma pretiosum]
MSITSVKYEYFLTKIRAELLINMVDYLNLNEIEEEQLEDKNILKNIVREGMGKFVGIKRTLLYLKAFKSMILNFKIDYLKTVNLYRLNYGILAVACVEYILYPNQNYEQYLMIYDCSKQTAEKLYNKLCNFPYIQKQTVDIVKSARSFFQWQSLLCKPGYLKTIREYLRKIEINNDELSFIKDTSIQVIRDNKVQQSRSSTRAGSLSNTAPKPGSSKSVKLKLTSYKRRSNFTLITKEYFFNKRHVNAIMNLHEYLIAEEIEEDYLEDKSILWDMLRRAMKIFPNREPAKSEFNAFKSTLLTFNIDYLKTVNLYRLNYGILVVACIEYAMYPDEHNEKYRKIYRCDKYCATKYYNELCGLPEREKQDSFTVKSSRSFFFNNIFLTKPVCLEAIRSYLQHIEIGNDELKYIRDTSIQVIRDNAAKNRVEQSPNIIDPIEDH